MALGVTTVQQRKGRPENLNPGGTPGNKGNTTTGLERRSRKAALQALASQPSIDGGTILDKAMAVIAGWIEGGDKDMATYLVNQVAGTPATRVEHVIEDSELLDAVIGAMRDEGLELVQVRRIIERATGIIRGE